MTRDEQIEAVALAIYNNIDGDEELTTLHYDLVSDRVRVVARAAIAAYEATLEPVMWLVHHPEHDESPEVGVESLSEEEREAGYVQIPLYAIPKP